MNGMRIHTNGGRRLASFSRSPAVRCPRGRCEAECFWIVVRDMRRAALLAVVCCCAASAAEHTARVPTLPQLKRRARPPSTASADDVVASPTLLSAPAADTVAAAPAATPSMYWAVLHNWLYFLSLGFNAVNVAFLVRQIVNGDLKPSPESIALSGKVESVDKMLTFLGVGLLSTLSDVHGRKPLMAW